MSLDVTEYEVTLSHVNRKVALNIIHLCRALRHLALDKSAIDPGNFLSILSHSAFQQDDKRALLLNALPDALKFADLTLILSDILDHSPLSFECVLGNFLRILPNNMLEAFNKVLFYLKVKQGRW